VDRTLSVLAFLIEETIWDDGNGLPISSGLLVLAVHQCMVQIKPIYQLASRQFKNQKFNYNYNFVLLLWQTPTGTTAMAVAPLLSLTISNFETNIQLNLGKNYFRIYKNHYKNNHKQFVQQKRFV